MKDLPVLTEKELESVIRGENPRRGGHIFLNVIAMVALCFLTYIVLNYKTVFSNVSYWYKTEFKAQNYVDEEDTEVIEETGVQEDTRPEMAQISDNSLIILSLNIEAPITWRIENTTEKVQKGLEQGIIHIDSTALPGEQGNVFITGHSSNYPWAKGEYNNIFALLDKLVAGDKIQLKYQEQDYLYEVTNKKVVPPSDLSVLESGNDSFLTLMTCTPVGTSLRRLIVTSKQIYPNPENNKAIERNSTVKELPKAR